jgi:transposase InsO family protein
MRVMGLAGARRAKTTIAAVSNPNAQCPLDKVNREFRVSRPNVLWVVDFTYVHTWVGFVYVAFVIDACARRVVGWKVSASAPPPSSWMPWNRLSMPAGLPQKMV